MFERFKAKMPSRESVTLVLALTACKLDNPSFDETGSTDATSSESATATSGSTGDATNNFPTEGGSGSTTFDTGETGDVTGQNASTSEGEGTTTTTGGVETVGSTTAAEPFCGDGVVDDGEECDDGNANNNDACLDTCLEARCGDGYLWTEDIVPGKEEQCDDGDTCQGEGEECKNGYCAIPCDPGNDQCPGDLVCFPNERCATPCEADADCPSGNCLEDGYCLWEAQCNTNDPALYEENCSSKCNIGKPNVETTG